jgi:rhamnogalacturonyl hydrolase YesR
MMFWLLSACWATRAAAIYTNATLAKASEALATLQASRAVEDLLSEKPSYEGALLFLALDEAGADASLLDGTPYITGDDDGAVLEFLRGGDDVEDYASFVGESLGDKLSAAAALLVPLAFDATVNLQRARDIVLDYQLVPDTTMGGDDARGFVTALAGGGASFYRQQTSVRTSDGSGGGAGWNDDYSRDGHKVAWSDDVFMGVLNAAVLVEHHDIEHSDAVAIATTLANITQGFLKVFGNLTHGFDLDEGASSEARWSRACGWAAVGLELALGALLRPDVRGAVPANAIDAAHATLVEYLDRVVALQDPASGLWWQVMDAPDDPRNYIETSGSSLIVAALAGLYNRGGLPKCLEEQLVKAALALPGYVEDCGLSQSSRGTSIKARDYYFDLEALEARKNDYVGAAVLAFARVLAAPMPDPRLATPSFLPTRAPTADTATTPAPTTRSSMARAQSPTSAPAPAPRPASDGDTTTASVAAGFAGVAIGTAAILLGVFAARLRRKKRAPSTMFAGELHFFDEEFAAEDISK